MKNFVIIGGSSGIGEAIVDNLEADGNHIIASYNSSKKESRPLVKYVKLDVTTDALHEEDLPDKIHGLAYCPGSINLKSFHRFKEDDFISDFRLQVLGATKVIKQLLPKLKEAKGASIVLFSTVAVQTGFTFHSQVAISKGAIEGLTRALAAEFAPSIRVNAIAPALTNTKLSENLLNTPEKIQYHADKNPSKRIGEPQDLAAAACYLLSEKSSWVTGQIINVNGGFGNLA
jgi:NAD(P)-dependent dehydrogenase (short-subunit alcohol dehydrogenase family)